MKLYIDGKGNQFMIIDVEAADDVWVHYQRLSDHKEFSCLLEAFHERFTELVVV